ncbi:LysM peptidoglycan-binding domain-containing protein [Balneola sp. MJW-20]|uniref:LysM peptidoglycan-binding domain-containing protein n=1 Tax=Gracilimonas aurantiaca TaxID=3234185 RepID=UPI003467219D
MKNFFKTLKTLLLLLLVTLSSSSLSQAQSRSVYVVKSGDTLYSISKSIGVTLAELREWNSIQGNAITVGQELVYYATEPDTLSVAVVDEGESILVNDDQQTNVYYVVKSGDTLTKIAREHNMTLNQLRQLNNLQSDNIQIGQRLAVKAINYAPNVAEDASESAPQGKFSLYTLERGDNLQNILNRFRMTQNEFRQLNPDIDLSNLNRGQRVTVLLPPSKNYANPYLDESKLNDLGQVNATSYDASEAGATTTNGELYDPGSLTAAHSNIAIGTILYVENPATGTGIYVRINDRVTGNALKLSEKAFRILSLNNSPQPLVRIYTDQ